MFLDKKRLLLKEDPLQIEENKENNKKLTLKTVVFAYKVAGKIVVSLFLVYFLEYTCITCWADRASLKY